MDDINVRAIRSERKGLVGEGLAEYKIKYCNHVAERRAYRGDAGAKVLHYIDMLEETVRELALRLGDVVSPVTSHPDRRREDGVVEYSDTHFQEMVASDERYDTCSS